MNDIYHRKDKILIAVGIIIILTALMFLCGCNGNSAKLQDDLNQVKKNQEKIIAEQKIQGNNNTQNFNKISKNVDTTIQSNKKMNEQIKDGNKLVADKMGDVESKVSSSVNSSWMVWGIVVVTSVVAMIAILGVFWLMRYIIKSIDNIDDAVDDKE